VDEGQLGIGEELHAELVECLPSITGPEWETLPQWLRDFYTRWSVSSRLETMRVLDDLLATAVREING
jgi:hypothetical protein